MRYTPSHPRTVATASRLALLFALIVPLAGCGKKGPPLAPLHLIPGPATAIEIRRAGSDAHLQFVLPAANANGAGPSVLDRVQIYAVTVPPGTPAPPNRELLTPKFLVGTIEVKPPPVEGEPPPADAPPDTRPAAGDKVSFVEALTPDKLEAAPLTSAKDKRGATAAAQRAAGTGLLTTALATVPTLVAGDTPGALSTTVSAGPVAAAASFASATVAAIINAIPKHPVRLYAVQGTTKKGRAGQASARAELPIVPLPAVPAGVIATVTEKAIALTWLVAAAETPPTFNVYKRGAAEALNPAPIAAPPYEQAGVTWGTEQCFVVRAVEKVGTADLESEPSPAACVTPRDTFPPAAPKGLAVVAGPGTISLSWDANVEPDLGGYLVLRAEAPGDAFQALTPAPIPATNYEDKTAKPGTRYAYTIVAVDKATPPNRSAPSPRVEETSR